VSAAERQAVVAEARAWLGTPWHHEARVKGAGVDCGQFLAAVFEACGLVEHVEVEPYPQDWALHRGEERFLKTVEPTHRASIATRSRATSRCSSTAGASRTRDRHRMAAWFMRTSGPVVTLDDVEKNPDLARRLVGIWTLNRWR
jgi:hypothetical protein